MGPSEDAKTEETAGTEKSEPERTLLILDRPQWLYLSRRYELTPREVQIAELVCQGLRHGHIAGQLSIRPGTVKTHIRNIYRKVKVKSKVSMLLRFVSESRGTFDDRDRF